MAVEMIEVTAEQLLARRAELISQLAFDEAELWKRAAEDHTASPDERDIHDELVEIDFLLGKWSAARSTAFRQFRRARRSRTPICSSSPGTRSKQAGRSTRPRCP